MAIALFGSLFGKKQSHFIFLLSYIAIHDNSTLLAFQQLKHQKNLFAELFCISGKSMNNEETIVDAVTLGSSFFGK